MKRLRLPLLALCLLLPVAAFAAAPDFSGRWRLDPAKSTALDGWNAADLVIAVDGAKVTMTYHMTWRSSQVAKTNVLDTTAPRELKDFFRIEQRHLAIYARPEVPATVKAAWLDAGETLRVEADLSVETSQGNSPLRLYNEFRLLEGGQTLLLIELHSTRPKPLVYQFTKVPAEAAAK